MAAEEHFRRKEEDSMKDALQKVEPSDRHIFLYERGYDKEAIQALADAGNYHDYLLYIHCSLSLQSSY